MLNITSKSTVTTSTKDNHIFTHIYLNETEFNSLLTGLVKIVPKHYIDPNSIADILIRLGKPAASKKLRDKIPEVMNIRSGDIGEVLTTDYIEESTDFQVPIRKLRWRDHRNMAMRGDDVIGIHVNSSEQSVRFLKAEAKSYKALSNTVLTSAREELDNDRGLPAPHALGFIIDRLRGMGDDLLADILEKVQLSDDGIKSRQVEHLLFTFTASKPERLQKTALEEYSGKIKQNSVGFQVTEHQDLIKQVYKGIEDALNS